MGAYWVVLLTYSCIKRQYGVRIKLPGNRLYTKRLSGLFPSPGVTKFANELPDVRQKVLEAVNHVIHKLLVEGPPLPKRAGIATCSAAMATYENWHAKNRKINPRKFRYNTRPFHEYFADKPLSYIDAVTARKFIFWLIKRTPKYSYDTIRLAVAAASGLITWLIQEGLWTQPNPFIGLLKKHRHLFPAIKLRDHRIPVPVWAAIEEKLNLKKYATARIFIMVARCTGLRPSEIYRLNIKDIDRAELSWRLKVTKTAAREYHRAIAIPRLLLDFIDSTGITGELPLKEITVGKQLRKLSTEVGFKLTAKSFRKDFATGMEAAGAPPHVINAHQGRTQTGVLFENYLGNADRAVQLCRPYVDRLFPEQGPIQMEGGEQNVIAQVNSSTERKFKMQEKNDEQQG